MNLIQLPQYKIDVKKICIRVTRRCNLTCQYCLAPDNKETELSSFEIMEIVKYLNKYSLTSVSLSGGEPFIRKDLGEILYALQDLKIDKSVTSNGVKLNDEQIAFIKDTDTKIKISVHGIGENHNKLDGVNIFEKIDDNISLLTKANIRLTINSMISAKNISAIDELVNYSIQKGVKRIRFILFIPRGRGLSNEKSYILTDENKTAIKKKIDLAKEKFGNILDIRFSDYYAYPYIVLEPDGNLIKELPYEINDEVIWKFKSIAHATP